MAKQNKDELPVGFVNVPEGIEASSISANQNFSLSSQTVGDEHMIEKLTEKNRVVSFSSLNPTTLKEKANFYNTINNPDMRLKNCINMTLYIRHVYAEMVEIMSEASGCMEWVPRLIFIDKDGKSYTCVSKGVFNATARLFKIFGEPEWNDVPLVPKLIEKGKNNILTIDVDEKFMEDLENGVIDA